VMDYAIPAGLPGCGAAFACFEETVSRARGAMDARPTPLRKVTDGLSKTMLLVEAAGRPEHWTRLGRGPDRSTLQCGNFDIVDGQVLGGAWPDPRNGVPAHGLDIDGSGELVCFQDCVFNCSNNNEPFAFHAGGLQTVFVDGSVHFFSDDMDSEVYGALLTRAAGDAVDFSDVR